MDNVREKDGHVMRVGIRKRKQMDCYQASLCSPFVIPLRGCLNFDLKLGAHCVLHKQLRDERKREEKIRQMIVSSGEELSFLLRVEAEYAFTPRVQLREPSAKITTMMTVRE
jgi:hypothetical protein